MKRVGTRAITDNFSVNPRAALLRKLELFENHDSRAFTNHKAIAVSFKWPRRVERIVIIGRERAHRRKTRHAHRRDRRLRAAADHHVGIATFNDLETVANRVCACGAGCCSCGVWSLGAETNRHLAGGEIYNCGDNKEGRNAIWSIVEQFRVLALDGPEISDAA